MRPPMTSRPRLSRLLLMAGVGLSLQLLSSAPEFSAGRWVRTVIAEGEDGQPGFDGASKVNVVLVDHGSPQCEAAKRRAIEVAPELLALADWPLDANAPAECMTVRYETLAVVDDMLPAPEVIADIPAVVTVSVGELAKAAPLVSAHARPPLLDERQNPLGQQIAAIDAATLDEVRGGFELAGSNLKLSFGIERAVYINGELVASTVLNVKDLKLMAGAGGAPLTLPAGSNGALGIIQNGVGNNVTTQLSPNLAGTVIQNTLNGQTIQNVTTINASVNSIQVMRSMSVQSAIQNGIVNSLRR